MRSEPIAENSAGVAPSSPGTSDPAATRAGLQLLQALHQSVSVEAFLETALPNVLQSLGASAGGLVVQHLGRWRARPWVGEQLQVPEELISEAIDRRQVLVDGAWHIAPLRAAAETTLEPASGVAGETMPAPMASALALRFDGPAKAGGAAKAGDSAKVAGGGTAGPAGFRGPSERLAAVADWMRASIERLRREQWQRRRIEQLHAALDAAARWQRLDDDSALLHAIADTATELLGCQRASIFLWDRRRRKLIGRPALGIEGDALEVDDDAGVVGEVLRSGEPTLWNAGDDDERRVNRTVDHSHGFQTESLVAVPLSSGQDQVIGVFEAINRHQGGFDHSDVAVLKDLATHAAVAIQGQRTRRRLTASRDRLVDDAASASQLIGSDAAIQEIRETATKVAGTDLTVLVLGENGTGKEVLARHIHFQSPRRHAPFIAVNCAALVESLLESELFGHEQGAFTDAQQTRAGKFELAAGGTLFLDEVGDMSPGGQAKLLRVLEEKVVVRVGGSQPIPVDVRVIAATNQSLGTLIEEKRFREDLFFRLNVVSLTLPPLRDRGGDVIELAEHFLEQFSHQVGRRPVPRLEAEARQALLAHAWPGNIRELRNTIERVCYLSSGDSVLAEDLLLASPPAAVGRRADPAGDGALSESLGEATRQFQIGRIERAIAACRGNMTDAASRLGLHRSNLYRKMRQLGMEVSSE